MQPLDRLMTKYDPLFKAPPFEESALPPNFKLGKTHRAMLQRRNGGYFYGGALHVFGAAKEPAFHSLAAWNKADGWRTLYGQAVEGLVFFAEDAFGDQFGLDENGKVFVLRSEQGLVEELADDFDQWLLMAVEAPDELLARGTFTDWVQQHGHLPHGSQLQAFPPFSFAGDPEAVELEAVDAFDNMEFHGQIARTVAETLATLPEGARIKVEFTDEGEIRISTENAPAENNG